MTLGEILSMRMKTYEALVVALEALAERGTMEKSELEVKRDLKKLSRGIP